MICTCIEYIVTNVVFKIITVQTPEFGLNSGKETEDNPCSALKKNNKKKKTHQQTLVRVVVSNTITYMNHLQFKGPTCTGCLCQRGKVQPLPPADLCVGCEASSAL